MKETAQGRISCLILRYAFNSFWHLRNLWQIQSTHTCRRSSSSSPHWLRPKTIPTSWPPPVPARVISLLCESLWRTNLASCSYIFASEPDGRLIWLWASGPRGEHVQTPAATAAPSAHPVLEGPRSVLWGAEHPGPFWVQKWHLEVILPWSRWLLLGMKRQSPSQHS